MDLLDLADRSWPLLNRLTAGHIRLYRATGGRLGQRVPGLPPMLLLDHVGAKSARGAPCRCSTSRTARTS